MLDTLIEFPSNMVFGDLYTVHLHCHLYSPFMSKKVFKRIVMLTGEDEVLYKNKILEFNQLLNYIVYTEEKHKSYSFIKCILTPLKPVKDIINVEIVL